MCILYSWYKIPIPTPTTSNPKIYFIPIIQNTQIQKFLYFVYCLVSTKYIPNIFCSNYTKYTYTNFFMFSTFVHCLLCFLTSLLKNIIYFLHNYKILCVLCFRKNIFPVYCLYDFCYTNISVLCFKKIKFSALKIAIV